MLRISWRLQRFGLIVMSAFGLFYGSFQAAAYKSAAGTTHESQVAFGHQMEVLAASLTYLLPKPVGLDTMAGFLQWRVYGAVPLLFAVWCIFSAAGASRGDEDRGLVDEWASAGASPVRYLALRFAVFAVACAIAVAVTSGAIELGAASAGATLDTGRIIGASAALLGCTLTCYAILLVVAQLTGSRNATAGVGGAVLAVLFFINGFGRTVDSLHQIAQVISPFYYYDKGNAVAPAASFDAAAVIGLFAAAAALTGMAMGLMRQRDLGSSLLHRRAREAPSTVEPARNPLLRMPILSYLYEQRVGLIAWIVGISLGAVYMASLGHSLVDLTKGGSAFKNYLTLAGHGDPYVALTAFFWFGIFELLLAAFAIAQVARWASDDNEGRLEMVLSAPVSRTRVVLERATALLIGTTLLIVFSSAAFYLAAHGAGIDIRAGDLFQASLAAIPFGLSFAGIGALLASRVPRQTVVGLAAVVFVSYLITEAGPLLRWPDWVMRLSLLSLYGNPLVTGIDWTGLWILIAVTVVGFGLASVLMQRRDVGA